MGETEDERTSQAGQLFENFVQASTCKGTMQAFCILCRQLELDPSNYTDFYHSLKSAVTSWKAKGLWSKLDKRASHKEYMKGKACTDTKCLVIGSGPCGLRTAIELAFLGAKVVVIEKRDTFSRNNVLHLWPYTIHDLRGLGAKKFYGKFCAGSIDHISIRQLQLMLLKIALIVGVEVHVNVEFIKLLEPPEDQPNEGPGWRAEIRPAGHPISDFDFDVVVGADGRRSTLDGFRRKEFRGKLAIAITANFVNRNTTAEAKVEEISGVAFIFNQKFFLDLKEETGIDLENIVYYKDNTHYFVMTAKKQSLLDKGVIIHDYIETERLLSSQNVDQEALLSYAREAADFGTNYQLPSLDYAINHYGQPDVAMFDFTCMYASENAALVRENFRHQLLVALVGDSLLEPFWPMGTGCARGFLAAFDTAWMVRGWAQGRAPLEILAERESIYRLLPQTTPENINKNFDQYTIDPSTRYPNLNANCVRPHQVQHLYMNGDQDSCSLQGGGPLRSSVSLSRQELEIRPRQLLSWCQKQTQGYRGVEVTDLTSSWKSGLALCALIHSYRPDLIDFDSLNEADSSRNNQLAFDVAEREFGIQPVTTGAEIAAEREPDKLLMVLYLSKFYEIFYATAVPAAGVPHERDENNDSSTAATAVYNLINFTLPRKRIPKEEKLEDKDATNRKRRKGSKCLEELVPSQSAAPPAEGGNARENKVRSMATQLLAKFEENAASGEQRRQSESDCCTESLARSASLDMAENPRFSKPKDQTFPSAPSQPKWQPSIYLRLLSTGSSPQCKTQPPKIHLGSYLSLSPVHSPPPSPQPICRKATVASPPSHTTGNTSRSCLAASSSSSSSCPLTTTAMSDMLQRLQHLEDKICQVSLSSSCSAPAATRSSTVSVSVSSSLSCFPLVLTPPEPLKQRTVGKVSSVIGAKALTLAILYENDHRLKPAGSSLSPSKEFPQNLGGSDICSFCQKRVYVMERLSAEGHFFHRECFRCSICRCTLRLGGHAFDSEQGKFYCKMHFSQAKVKSKTRRRTIEGSGVTLLDGHNLSTSPGSLQSHASDGWNQETHRGRLDPSMVVEESGDAQHIMSSENLGSSEADREQTDRTSGPFASGKSQKEAEPGASDCKGGLSKGSSRSHFWRRKIRSTLPLILVKTFDHGKTKGLPEADSNSDFEDISALTSTGDPERSSQENNPAPTEVLNYRQDQISSELQSPSLSLVSPRKKLVLSASEKEKLLDWDLGAPESEVKPRKFSFRQNDTKSETLPQNPEPASMTPPNSPPLSTFQFWASTLRRSFGASGNSISVTGVTKRPKAPKVRPVSEGPLYFTSLFGSASQEQQSCPAPAEGQLGRQKSGSDLTTLLEQVALSTKPMGTSKDDMASLPPRKLNFFSSLRVKRREGEVRRGVDNQKDIWTILSKFRNKGSSQREEEACCSSSSDEEQHTEPQKPQRSSVERQRKRQEKLVQQQARREQLKRLHRAQVIQRQLEEVEEKQRALEEKGVALEKILRGETGDQSSDEHQLLQTWFKLVLEKNKLERYESELMIFAQELELEDTQSQLQRDLRSRMAMDDSKKSPEDLKEEQELLVHIMQVVEKRDQLVSLLEEQRLRERAEDRDLESMVLSRGYQVHWT
ncbi:F-actin-monooxygenase mical2b isoform X3 [Denticeps clupeoides]|uniref:F-actin-monooxygenase mical2b isoform X3 n=1 Tax=Denticeps clupeoides TaxID=299321 RepID=UPI0010A4E4DE|nr:protein-methionine sulfoxide oxidase mical2b-like isoform X3 [Denticeps clupeoides]